MSLVDIARLFDFVHEAGENRGLRVEAIQHWSRGQYGDSWCAEFATMVLDIANAVANALAKLGVVWHRSVFGRQEGGDAVCDALKSHGHLPVLCRAESIPFRAFHAAHELHVVVREPERLAAERECGEGVTVGRRAEVGKVGMLVRGEVEIAVSGLDFRNATLGCGFLAPRIVTLNPVVLRLPFALTERRSDFSLVSHPPI